MGLTVFLVGFRVGLNIRTSNVIDVGYSGVIGAYLIAHEQSPYGNFPVEDNRPKCGPADATGEVRDRIQTNGRCETADALGDTYGPVAYEAYLPGFLLLGWSGKWDSLPTARTVIDPLGHAVPDRAVAVGFASGASTGRDARLRVGRLAVHAVLVELQHERPLISPALLVWAFWFPDLLATPYAGRSRRSRPWSSSRP